jgi:class 3 adenylate cyclase/tetratricopeptide (TPR) repeat protein
VSVLFADLVGFTTLSESRDAEEVRELLARYFDVCRRLVELYGGEVEKFIGDAVMAVWGAPTATEDDAERAVRAALDLVAAVSAFGDEIGAPLQARAGVLTGEAAVTPGATGQGMVAGDLVNTASRVQSVAEPGSVFVGEATRWASEQAVVYEPAGSFELKGKEGETELWRALRVVSGRAGSLKSQGLEAPFVGRDRELRQIKELFHVCAEERRSQLVSVTGIAGIGKSRLVWEFYKYFDGIEQIIYWHRGRCLAYGEGVTYWALADMVRMRCGIAEEDSAEVAERKLKAALEEHILDADERQFIQPRLGQLLGIEGREDGDKQELFAAWRLFFERLADVYPTVLAFEDMQWADSSLLDFVEYLLEWSRGSPLYVVTMARPELVERRPTWGAGHRNFTSLYLEPLSEPAMSELLAGLVPGLPSSVRDQILARAEGVPLYAVETVRMLLDRGLLAEQGSTYAVVGEVTSLEVPETLQALVAARLDGLAVEERRLLQDAAVLGKTFTPTALAAVSGSEPADLEPLLGGLVRKELLGLQSDPRSPELGQYGFLQDLIRRVAYETLSKKERRAKHLAAAEYLGEALGEEEVVEVVAAHLLDAYRLDPDADHDGALLVRARRALQRAGERAAGLGASPEARRYFEQAAELSDDDREQASALMWAGRMAIREGAREEARTLFEGAMTRYEQAGDTHAAAGAAGWLGQAEGGLGRYEQAIERMEAALAMVEADEPDTDVAYLLARLGRAYMFLGDVERALATTERALVISEALDLSEPLILGWRTKSDVSSPERPQEARGLLELALRTALERNLTDQAIGTCSSLADLCLRQERYEDSLDYLGQMLEIARRTGDRAREWFAVSEHTYALYMLGRWEESLEQYADISEHMGQGGLLSPLTGVLEIHLHRGDIEEARNLLTRCEEIGRSDDVQARSAYLAATSALLHAEGRLTEALATAESAFELARETFGIASQDVKQSLLHGCDTALALGEVARAEALLEIVEQTPAGLRPPFLGAFARRFRALLAGDRPEADAHYAAAVNQLRKLDLPFHAAVVALDYGDWLRARGRFEEAETLLAGARETFEKLGAGVWLQRFAVDQTAAAEIPA